MSKKLKADPELPLLWSVDEDNLLKCCRQSDLTSTSTQLHYLKNRNGTSVRYRYTRLAESFHYVFSSDQMRGEVFHDPIVKTPHRNSNAVAIKSVFELYCGPRIPPCFFEFERRGSVEIKSAVNRSAITKLDYLIQDGFCYLLDGVKLLVNMTPLRSLTSISKSPLNIPCWNIFIPWAGTKWCNGLY